MAYGHLALRLFVGAVVAALAGAGACGADSPRRPDGEAAANSARDTGEPSSRKRPVWGIRSHPVGSNPGTDLHTFQVTLSYNAVVDPDFCRRIVAHARDYGAYMDAANVDVSFGTRWEEGGWSAFLATLLTGRRSRTGDMLVSSQRRMEILTALWRGTSGTPSQGSDRGACPALRAWLFGVEDVATRFGAGDHAWCDLELPVAPDRPSPIPRLGALAPGTLTDAIARCPAIDTCPTLDGKDLLYLSYSAAGVGVGWTVLTIDGYPLPGGNPCGYLPPDESRSLGTVYERQIAGSASFVEGNLWVGVVGGQFQLDWTFVVDISSYPAGLSRVYHQATLADMLESVILEPELR